METHGPRLDADPLARRHRHARLGWAGVIAFPHLFAQSFGPYGSATVSVGVQGGCGSSGSGSTPQHTLGGLGNGALPPPG